MPRPESILLAWVGEGQVERNLLERVRERVAETLARPTTCVAAAAPTGTLDARRGQHSSTRLLRWLLEHPPGRAEKLIGITDVDLFIPVLTFVFGEAQLGGAAAVVSLARLRETFDGRPAPSELLGARLVKECLHELGHTFGLIHCARASCVMSRSNSILDVDGKHEAFCRSCRILLRERNREAS